MDLLVASDKARKETEVQVAGFNGEGVECIWPSFFFVCENVGVLLLVSRLSSMVEGGKEAVVLTGGAHVVVVVVASVCVLWDWWW